VTGRIDPGSLTQDVQTGAHPTAEKSDDECLGSQNGTATLFFTAPADVARLFKAVLATVQRRIERRNGRTASESTACAMAGAARSRGTFAFGNDHIRFRSARGPDDPWNRTALCAAHHQRCVHEGIGRIRIRGRAPDGLRFELPLVTYGPGERILR